MVDNLPESMQSKTPKAYKSKRLNNANFGDFSHTDYQVFLHLVSKIGGVDKLGKYLQPEQLQREHILTAKEFSEVFNTPLSHSYGILKKAVDKLMKTDIKVEKIEPKREVWRINVCSQAQYNEKEGSITIEFTDRIMPYLAQVRHKFVLYNLKEVADFGSLYTTRLYELLKGFQETGWMLKSIEQLREIFAVGNKLKPYNNFKQRTFEPACKEINSLYNMGLSFEEIKEGKKVTAVKFSFKPTAITSRTDQQGNVRNEYIKPALKNKSPKKLKTKLKPNNKQNEILDGQLTFKESVSESKIEDTIEPKSITSILAPFLQKLLPKKK